MTPSFTSFLFSVESPSPHQLRPTSKGDSKKVSPFLFKVTDIVLAFVFVDVGRMLSVRILFTFAVALNNIDPK